MKTNLIQNADGYQATFGSRHYNMCAVERPTSSKLRVTIRATGKEKERFHIDTVDLYRARPRKWFATEAAHLFGQEPKVVETDLAKITTELETLLQKKTVPVPGGCATMTKQEEKQGLALGKSSNLVRQILADVKRLGVVGESMNVLASYLTMTSRKMDDPLSMLVLATSGSGKSHLQDTILSLCPDEDLIKLTSMSDRSLFYKGADALKHKVLAIEEQVGAAGSDYALRCLISAKRLVIESVNKSSTTGKLETQAHTVHGPTAVFLTTTNTNTDPETKSRFLVLGVDESPEQTKAILDVQRQSHTLEALLRKKEQETIRQRHHLFQRLLRPLVVVNPLESTLRFGNDHLRSRRDHPKFLRLVLVSAFLHQMQRKVKHHPELGDYIEVEPEDVTMAHELAVHILGSNDLNASSRGLLGFIVEKMKGQDFTRRQLREAIGWSDARLRNHLKELVNLEHVDVLRGSWGSQFLYRVAERTIPIRNFAKLRRSEAHRAKSPIYRGKTNGSKPHFAALRGVETRKK